jgi:hypothetical protein
MELPSLYTSTTFPKPITRIRVSNSQISAQNLSTNLRMSQTQAPQPERQQLSKAEFHQRTLRNTAIATAVACPILVLLPPRKLDFFTVGLCITTVFSTNYLVADYTGRTITQHITGARPPVLSSAGAQQTDDAQTRVSDAVRLERQEALLRAPHAQSVDKEKTGIAEQVEASRQQAKWAIERQREEQEALDEGKGFGDIIMDQVYEVWNWGKKRDADDDEN